jgi:hypothetical protein
MYAVGQGQVDGGGAVLTQDTQGLRKRGDNGATQLPERCRIHDGRNGQRTDQVSRAGARGRAGDDEIPSDNSAKRNDGENENTENRNHAAHNA